MKVLFLTRYSQRGGSSRYMVHQYLPAYAQAGMTCTVAPLFDDRYFDFGVLDRPTGIGELRVTACTMRAAFCCGCER